MRALMGLAELGRNGCWDIAVEYPDGSGRIWWAPGGCGAEPEGGVHEFRGEKFMVVLFDERPWPSK